MATDLENLKARKSQIIAALSTLGTAPDYSIEGQSVNRSQQRRSLLEELGMINDLIGCEEPFELQTQGYTR